MKYFFLVLVSVLFWQCDDGDLPFETIDFTNNNLQVCNNNESNFYLFKTDQNKSLVLRIPQSNFVNFATNNQPRLVPLGGSNLLTYRVYNRDLGNQDICTILPPADLMVSQEWVSQSGVVEITTEAIKSPADANLATRVIRYRHRVRVLNLTFLRDGQLQTQDVFNVGIYETNAQSFADFTSVPIFSCTTTDQKLKINNNQSLTLQIPLSLLANEATPAGAPRKAAMDATNQLRYQVFANAVTNAALCGTSSVSPLEQWQAANGTIDQDGWIEITTIQTNDPNTAQVIWVHDIVLKRVRLVRNTDQVDFLLGENYLFGQIITQ